MRKVILTQDYLKKKKGDEIIVSEREWEILQRLNMAEKPKKNIAKRESVKKDD